MPDEIETPDLENEQDELEDTSTPPNESEASNEATQEPAPQGGFDPDAFAAALARHIPQPPPQMPPQVSREDMERTLNVYKPTEEVVNRLLDGGPAAVQALNEVVAGLRKEFGTVFPQQMQTHFAQFNQQLAPIRQQYEQNLEKQFTSTLVSEHKDLEPAKQLLPMMYRMLQQSGFKPSSNDPRVVRREVADAIRRALPPGTLAASSGGGRKPQLPNGDGGSRTKPPAKQKGDESGFDAVFNALYGN